MSLLSTFWRHAKERKRELTWMFVALALGWVVMMGGFWFVAYRISTQMSMETWARYAGGLQAKVWFDRGDYRLLELSPDEKVHSTGRTNGPFEIWTWTHHANAPLLSVKTADQMFVDAFNSRMERLWSDAQMEAEPVAAPEPPPAAAESESPQTMNTNQLSEAPADGGVR